MWRTYYVALLFLSSLHYSEHKGMCDLISWTTVPGPPIKYQMSKPNNGSLDINTCGPLGSPDIIYTSIPKRVTSETSYVLLNAYVMSLADVDGGFLDASVVFEPGMAPFDFHSSFDCGLFLDVPCPLPVKEGEWMHLEIKCDTRFYIPNMDAKLNLSIRNYTKNTVLCAKGIFRTF
ncbi:uncharacterized protein LOC117116554 [Anneissia japonica]|uniref:uncharacterized protein LOC117116554 n=1 Tax=Anneissia japonica TaxID=1529436 RepID=UPI001425940E|nr:uncharacterized protein LOC117116554 [Anneissia japonica]